MDDKDEYYMRKALALARKGEGLTSPNPLVGAIVVKDGEIAGKGYHKRPGGPHAEVIALDEAGSKANGAVLYVSLEPCCHHGKTPPCTDKIIEYGLKRVVSAAYDPNPLVNGKGIKTLSDAGIETRCGLLEDRARMVNEVFFKYIETGMPFVTIKGAVTADGKIASRTGNSRWITCEESRKESHRLRFAHDSIIVGVNTVLSDDPLLTCRLPGKKNKKPVKIVVDSSGKTPLQAKLFETDGHSRACEVIIASTIKIAAEKKKAFEEKGASVLTLPEKKGRVDLAALFQALAKTGITSCLVEGGGELNASIIEDGLADKLVIFIGPRIIGGKLAPTLVGGEGGESMEDSHPLLLHGIKKIKSDIMAVYYFSKFRKGK